MTEQTNPPLFRALWSDARECVKLKRSITIARAGDVDEIGSLLSVVDVVTLPGYWAVAMWRLANALHDRRLRPLSRLAYFANLVLFGADLHPGAVVGPGLVMPHPVGIGSSSHVILGARCRVMGLVRIGGGGRAGQAGHPVIGDDVWLMDGAKIFGPVSIGDRSVIGANVLLSKSVDADSLVLAPRVQPEIRHRDGLAAPRAAS